MIQREKYYMNLLKELNKFWKRNRLLKEIIVARKWLSYLKTLPSGDDFRLIARRYKRNKDMKLTQQQIKANAHITIKQIKIDIVDTQREIADFQDERTILMRNPQDNRVRLYMIDGKISKRIEFIEFLEALLKARD